VSQKQNPSQNRKQIVNQEKKRGAKRKKSRVEVGQEKKNVLETKRDGEGKG